MNSLPPTATDPYGSTSFTISVTPCRTRSFKKPMPSDMRALRAAPVPPPLMTRSTVHVRSPVVQSWASCPSAVRLARLNFVVPEPFPPEQDAINRPEEATARRRAEAERTVLLHAYAPAEADAPLLCREILAGDLEQHPQPGDEPVSVCLFGHDHRTTNDRPERRVKVRSLQAGHSMQASAGSQPWRRPTDSQAGWRSAAFHRVPALDMDHVELSLRNRWADETNNGQPRRRGGSAAGSSRRDRARD